MYTRKNRRYGIQYNVKIKHVAESDSNWEINLKNPLKKRFKKFWKKLLTQSISRDILNKSLEGDTKKQKVTTKVVKENGLWKLNRII